MHKRATAVLIVFLFAGCASGAAPKPEPLPVAITLTHGDERERETQAQLDRLLRTYDVRPWIFTDKIVIESGRRVIPHSHPVLTLSTRHLKDDELLLSTFVHEQIHWFMGSRSDDTAKAIAELEKLFPEVPAGHPEGARDEYSTYLHLLVCTLEDDAMNRLLGELRARQVLQFWTTDHYQWVYRQVLERGGDLRGILAKHRLDPSAGPSPAPAAPARSNL